MNKLLTTAALALATFGGAALAAAPAQAGGGYPQRVEAHYAQPVGYVTVRRVYRVETCRTTYKRIYDGYRWIEKEIRTCSSH